VLVFLYFVFSEAGRYAIWLLKGSEEVEIQPLFVRLHTTTPRLSYHTATSTPIQLLTRWPPTGPPAQPRRVPIIITTIIIILSLPLIRGTSSKSSRLLQYKHFTSARMNQRLCDNDRNYCDRDIKTELVFPTSRTAFQIVCSARGADRKSTSTSAKTNHYISPRLPSAFRSAARSRSTGTTFCVFTFILS